MVLSWENWFVQGVERVEGELLDAEALVGHLVAVGSMFAFLAEHRQDVFADGEFEDCFPRGGAALDSGVGDGFDSGVADIA
jgi:hypothetical protein